MSLRISGYTKTEIVAFSGICHQIGCMMQTVRMRLEIFILRLVTTGSMLV